VRAFVRAQAYTHTRVYAHGLLTCRCPSTNTQRTLPSVAAAAAAAAAADDDDGDGGDDDDGDDDDDDEDDDDDDGDFEMSYPIMRNPTRRHAGGRYEVK